MERWRVEFLPEAAREFARLDKPVRVQVAARIDWLAENIETTRPLALQEELKGHFKLRAGDWRIAYTFDTKKKVIVVSFVKHRSKAYRKRKV